MGNIYVQVVFILAIMSIVVLTIGTPDLLDAFILEAGCDIASIQNVPEPPMSLGWSAFWWTILLGTSGPVAWSGAYTMWKRKEKRSEYLMLTVFCSAMFLGTLAWMLDRIF